jgi:hypothetical protein
MPRMENAMHVLRVGLVVLLLAGCSGKDGATDADSGPDVDVPDPGGDPGTTDEAADGTVDGDPGALDAPEADAPLPGTPVGLQMAWFVERVNQSAAGTHAFTEADFDAHFSDAFRAGFPFDAFVASILPPYTTRYAPMVVEGHEDSDTDTTMWARVHATGGTPMWIRIYLRVEAATGLIEALNSATSPDLDPAFGPLPADQVGVFLSDSYEGKETFGFRVEAVDRATGLALEPPVVATTDGTYGYARLKVPAGKGEVGVKVTHSDGQVTYVFSTDLVAGKDRVGLPAFPSTAFPAYAERVGLTPAAGKAQVWGYLAHDPGTGPWAVEPLSWGVGCATIASVPAVDRVYYTTSPRFPNVGATQTALPISTFFVFNVDAVAHTFTAQAAGAPLVVADVPLAADAITALYMVFGASAYPANPTPEDCEP